MNAFQSTGDALSRLICNTLLHSLWQGILLAVVTGAIVLTTRNRSARERYNYLVAALLLFTIGSVITLVYEWLQLSTTTLLSAAPAAPSLTAGAAEVVVVTGNAHNAAALPGATGVEVLLQQLSGKYAHTIAAAWFLIICAKTIQLLAGLQGTYYMRRNQVSGVNVYWQQQVQQLAVSLGIRRSVQLLESGLAKVPMAIGYLKPVVLMPLGLLTRLPAEETLAILVHELAHIRRRDYLVNLLQSFVEIVFFFNPAVWWIGGLIREERENCCDDMALQQTTSKTGYIRALVSCQEFQPDNAAYAMMLKTSRGGLMHRVQRMVNSRNHSLNRREKALLSICLIAGIVLMAGVHSFEQPGKKHAQDMVVTKDTAAVGDTTRKQRNQPASSFKIYSPAEFGNQDAMVETTTRHGVPHETIVIRLKNNDLYQINKENGALSSLQINGKTIPASQWNQYQERIDSIEQHLPQPPAPPAPPATVTEAAAAGSPAPAPRPEPAQAYSVTATAPGSLSLSATASAAPAPPAPAAAVSVAPEAPAAAGGAVLRAGTARAYQDADSIAAFLFSRNVIPDKNHFTFSLNSRELKINDVVQPEALHQAVLQKFIKPGEEKNFSIAYASSVTSHTSNTSN